MSIAWPQVRDEVTNHLQRLIRFDTVNPPGNEIQVAQYLAGVVEAEGIEAQIVESEPGRANFVARIPGNGNGRPLLLMAHSDVVGVERDKWAHDPFGGELIDGQIWGRGAVDTKDLVAAELMVMLLVKRQNLTLDRDLVMCIFADEEAGGRFGADWMWKNRRELIDAEAAINEGGGNYLQIEGKRFYLCQTGEKGITRVRLTARGKPGHASQPLPDTAMLHAGQALTTLSEHQFPTVLTATVRRMLTTLGEGLGGELQSKIQAILAKPSWDELAALPLDEGNRRLLYATTRNTAVPTIIHGGHRINVIPSEVVIDVDGRILPGEQPERFADSVRQLVGDGVEVEPLSRGTGIEADPDSRLFDTIGAVMGDLEPGSRVIPYLIAGGTDARSLPGIKVYGFMPMRDHQEEAELAHAHDERVSVSNLEFGTQALFEIVRRYCNAR